MQPCKGVSGEAVRKGGYVGKGEALFALGSSPIDETHGLIDDWLTG